ncbi:MAG TPA: hypothetical protein VIX87_12045 [Steroidobacteraceae bacterium]
MQLDTSSYYITWNDIQQNIVPPICQIQWTQNLGAAVSKGFDMQADFDLLNSHTILIANHQVMSDEPGTGVPLATPLHRDIIYRSLAIGITVVFK